MCVRASANRSRSEANDRVPAAAPVPVLVPARTTVVASIIDVPPSDADELDDDFASEITTGVKTAELGLETLLHLKNRRLGLPELLETDSASPVSSTRLIFTCRTVGLKFLDQAVAFCGPQSIHLYPFMLTSTSLVPCYCAFCCPTFSSFLHHSSEQFRVFRFTLYVELVLQSIGFQCSFQALENRRFASVYYPFNP